MTSFVLYSPAKMSLLNQAWRQCRPAKSFGLQALTAIESTKPEYADRAGRRDTDGAFKSFRLLALQRRCGWSNLCFNS